MKTLFRCGFMSLIILGVAIQLVSARRGDAESDPMATLAAGLERQGIRIDQSTGTDVLTGHAPSCAQPIQAMLLRADGAEDGLLYELYPAGGDFRFIYLGSVEDKRDPAVIMSRWLWARTRYIVGLRSVTPSDRLVLVALPRTCPVLRTVDWATLSPSD